MANTPSTLDRREFIALARWPGRRARRRRRRPISPSAGRLPTPSLPLPNLER